MLGMRQHSSRDARQTVRVKPGLQGTCSGERCCSPGVQPARQLPPTFPASAARQTRVPCAGCPGGCSRSCSAAARPGGSQSRTRPAPGAASQPAAAAQARTPGGGGQGIHIVQRLHTTIGRAQSWGHAWLHQPPPARGRLGSAAGGLACTVVSAACLMRLGISLALQAAQVGRPLGGLRHPRRPGPCPLPFRQLECMASATA